MLQLLFTHISIGGNIARYSFIQLSELRHSGENENAQARNCSKRDSNPGCLKFCESGILPLSDPQSQYRQVKSVGLLIEQTAKRSGDGRNDDKQKFLGKASV